MKKSLLEIIACPVCKGTLQLKASEEAKDDEEIITGKLYCPACSHHYSISEGIPNLLPPESATQ